MEKPLEGLLVVSIEQAVAAPYCSRQLSKAGARVIKVERPEGDFARTYDAHVHGQSAYFVWLNGGKESLCLDLRDPSDAALLRRIAGRADVLLQNLAPGAMDRLGLPIGDMRRVNPQLVTCSISGYGQAGPLRDQKAYDLLVQAESGLCAITGGPEEPARVGVSVCDIAAGMTAFQRILLALIGRDRSGHGAALDVSLFESMADWMNVPYLQTRYGGAAPGRPGLRHPTIAPYEAFACADGLQLLISIQNDREWVRLCENLLGDDALADDPRFRRNADRVANRAALHALLAARFARDPRDQVIDALQDAGIAFGRLSEVEELATHPQIRFSPVDTGNGLADLIDLSGGAGDPPRVPALGQHSEAIRAEFAAP
ncbi:CaiB/BaiF CoA transferase family protein [Oceanomicrobium pacificus]|uniref:CoA transferase n=1 Tax=Oceanomicrobium pacificus TaxID=2692916 RepID=A0A6B0TPY5_9RHOB|nr:CaiB/BaiF CoA-transferase family protein [Oceanomicrobium pacificus]MXU63855.1 CoA transferase [Oceanomicrobium pacificus]